MLKNIGNKALDHSRVGRRFFNGQSTDATMVNANVIAEEDRQPGLWNDRCYVSLCEDLDENGIARATEWWHQLPMHHKHELDELTIAFQPWAIKLLPIGFVETTDDDLINDLYEFHVNHEIKGILPFFGRTGRDGKWGYYTGLVLAIPLLDPDWPPYDDWQISKSWEPQGKLRNADLGLDRPF